MFLFLIAQHFPSQNLSQHVFHHRPISQPVNSDHLQVPGRQLKTKQQCSEAINERTKGVHVNVLEDKL